MPQSALNRWVSRGGMAALLVPLMLAGPVHAQDSPEAAVDAVLDAVEGLQPDAASELVCADYREDTVSLLFPTDDMGGLPGFDPSVFLEALSVDISDRELELIEEADDWAVVHVNATVTVAIDETVAREFVTLVLGLMSDEIDEASIEAMTSAMLADMGSPQSVSADLEVIDEGDGWRVCEDLSVLFDGDSEAVVTDLGTVDAAAGESLCGLISIEELDAMGRFEYVDVDSSMAPNCMYSTDFMETFHSLSIGLDEFNDYDSLLSMWGSSTDVEELSVGDRPALYIPDFGALFVDSGAGMLGVSVLGADEVMTGQEVLDYAVSVAEIVVPRYLESLP